MAHQKHIDRSPADFRYRAADRAIQSKIGAKLQIFYSELIEQPVPKRFAELLRELEKDEEGRTGDAI
jgi:hypothetical protein